MVTLSDIREASTAIAGRVHRTPLLTSRSLGERLGVQAYAKAESLQKTGSFKARGVLSRLRGLSDEEKARGLISISAGNHAQALAWGASLEGLRCTVVMPAAASPSKVVASRAYGAEVILHGRGAEAFEKCEALRREHGFTFIHPFDDPGIIAGAGTTGLEIMEDVPDADVVVVPVGGGGLLSGIATAVKALRPQARVVGVEPEGAQSLTAGLREGRPVRLEHLHTIADGLAAPFTGENVLEHARSYVDEVVLVSEEEIVQGLHFVLERMRLVVEPAGAAAVAALLAEKVAVPAGGRVVAVISGGNIDFARLVELLA